MSITFFSPQAPQDVDQSYDCQCMDYDDGPWEDCYHCNGEGRVSFYCSSLEVQMSNANARDVLAAIGLPADGPLWGGWESVDEKADAMRRIIRTLNSSSIEDSAIEPCERRGERRVVQEGDTARITSGATLIQGGRPEGYIQTRLEQIQKLLQAAITNDWTVNWS